MYMHTQKNVNSMLDIESLISPWELTNCKTDSGVATLHAAGTAKEEVVDQAVCDRLANALREIREIHQQVGREKVRHMLWHDCCRAFWAKDGNGVPEMHRDAQLVSALLWWAGAPYCGPRDSRTHDTLGTYRINSTTTPEEAFDLLNFRFTHNFSHGSIRDSLRPVCRLKADVGLEMLEEIFCDLKHDLDRPTAPKAALAATTAVILEKSIANLFISHSHYNAESLIRGWMWRLLSILDTHYQHIEYTRQVFDHLSMADRKKLAVGIELVKQEFDKVLGLHENVKPVLSALSRVIDSD